MLNFILIFLFSLYILINHHRCNIIKLILNINLIQNIHTILLHFHYYIVIVYLFNFLLMYLVFRYFLEVSILLL